MLPDSPERVLRAVGAFARLDDPLAAATRWDRLNKATGHDFGQSLRHYPILFLNHDEIASYFASAALAKEIATEQINQGPGPGTMGASTGGYATPEGTRMEVLGPRVQSRLSGRLHCSGWPERPSRSRLHPDARRGDGIKSWFRR